MIEIVKGTTPEPEMEDCEECDGAGEVKCEGCCDECGACCEEYMTCDTCDGTGEVEVAREG